MRKNLSVTCSPRDFLPSLRSFNFRVFLSGIGLSKFHMGWIMLAWQDASANHGALPISRSIKGPNRLFQRSKTLETSLQASSQSLSCCSSSLNPRKHGQRIIPPLSQSQWSYLNILLSGNQSLCSVQIGSFRNGRGVLPQFRDFPCLVENNQMETVSHLLLSNMAYTNSRG